MGIGLLRYLVTEPLLVYIAPIRNALFRDFRRRLADHPQLARWNDNEYVPPSVSSRLLNLKTSDAPSAAADNEIDRKEAGNSVEAEESPIGRVLGSLIRQKESRKQPIWLVQGQSGLGKSAFLQQVARAALERGMTPLLLPLGSPNTPDVELATMMSEWGDMNVSPTTATDMVDGGGFVVLLDALNEDRHQSESLNFVRKARKRNIVLVSSQTLPSWSQIPIERLELAQFGREQLGKVLPAGWLDRVLEARHLAPVVGLPITALLLSKYISTHECLPASDFAIYASLSEGLDPNEVLNLEQVAWELFKCNGQQLKADDMLSEAFCEEAVRKSLLTRRSGEKDFQYRFVHERVHRYFVARYLRRQDDQTLSSWHEKLEPGFGKSYWADVIEFLAATFAASEGETINARTIQYILFLRQSAKFAPRVFSDRLYGQYQRYRDEGQVHPDANFQDWAASFLAAVVSGREPE